MGDSPQPDISAKKQMVADEAAEGGRRSAEPSPQPPARMEDGEEPGAGASSAASSVSGAGLEDGEGTTQEEGGKPGENGRGGGRGGPSRPLQRGAYQHQHSAASDGGNGHAPGGGVGGGMEPTSAIKLLVSAQLAGCLIGKGGATINELQERTGARIKLSQNNDFFPGTQDRIVLISGDADTVPHALSLVIEHLHSNAQARAGAAAAAAAAASNINGSGSERGGSSGASSTAGSEEDGDQSSQQQGGAVTTSVKLLIAKGAGGLVIGRGGATIKMLNEESGARIQLAAKGEAAGVVTGERVVTVSGPLDGVLKGVSRIMEKLNEEPELARYQNLTTSYSRSTGPAHPMHPAFDIPTYHTQSFAETQQLFSPGGPGGAPVPSPHTPHGQPGGQAGAALTMQVPDKLVGSILGKGGSTLKEIQQQTGARVTISKRGEFAPGTQNRVVTIEGPPYNADVARGMIAMRLQAAMGPPPPPSPHGAPHPHGPPPPHAGYGAPPHHHPGAPPHHHHPHHHGHGPPQHHSHPHHHGHHHHHHHHGAPPQVHGFAGRGVGAGGGPLHQHHHHHHQPPPHARAHGGHGGLGGHGGGGRGY